MSKLPPDHTLESSGGQFTVYWRKMLGNFPVCRKPTEQDAIDAAWRIYKFTMTSNCPTLSELRKSKCINDD